MDRFTFPAGDKKTIDIFQSMNAGIKVLDDGYQFCPGTLNGTVIDLNDCPDLGPMLFALATQANGKRLSKMPEDSASKNLIG